MTTPAIPAGWAKFLSRAKISFLIFMVSFQKTIKTAPFGAIPSLTATSGQNITFSEIPGFYAKKGGA
jgi:hypothetical protein